MVNDKRGYNNQSTPNWLFTDKIKLEKLMINIVYRIWSTTEYSNQNCYLNSQKEYKTKKKPSHMKSKNINSTTKTKYYNPPTSNSMSEFQENSNYSSPLTAKISSMSNPINSPTSAKKSLSS